MKRRTLRQNPASPMTKKNKQKINSGEMLPKPSDDIESEVLTWDGILAAMTFSVPFVVIIAINVQASIAVTLVLAAVLIPVSLLCFCLRERLELPSWITAPICALVSTGITAFAALYIRSEYPQVNDALGMYLYLLAAYPVVRAVFYGKRAKTISTTLAWAFRNIIYFGVFTITAGIVREILAYNTFVGIDLEIGFKLEGAKMPFFGFIVFAFILAGLGAAHRAVRGHLLTSQSVEEEYSSIEMNLMTETTKRLSREKEGIPEAEADKNKEIMDKPGEDR